jgi:hypothetical protein
MCLANFFISAVGCFSGRATSTVRTGTKVGLPLCAFQLDADLSVTFVRSTLHESTLVYQLLLSAARVVFARVAAACRKVLSRVLRAPCA